MTADEDNIRNPPQEPDSSRRAFLKLAAAASLVLAAMGVFSVTKAINSPGQSQETVTTGTASTNSGSAFPRYKIANLNDIKTNTPVPFNYPLDDEPNILVKLGQKAAGGVGPEGDIVAFSVICQHLGCVYGFAPSGSSPTCDSSFTASGPVGYCCCHGTVYDLANGAKVLDGPSPRPAPQVTLQVDASSGDVFAVGMGPPTVFGHDTGSESVLGDLQGGTPVS